MIGKRQHVAGKFKPHLSFTKAYLFKLNKTIINWEAFQINLQIEKT